MVLSASLSHSMGNGPTVAAVSVSIDPAAAKYIGFVTLQSKTHFIEGIKDLTLKALTGFYEGKKIMLQINELSFLELYVYFQRLNPSQRLSSTTGMALVKVNITMR